MFDGCGGEGKGEGCKREGRGGVGEGDCLTVVVERERVRGVSGKGGVVWVQSDCLTVVVERGRVRGVSGKGGEWVGEGKGEGCKQEGRGRVRGVSEKRREWVEDGDCLVERERVTGVVIFRRLCVGMMLLRSAVPTVAYTASVSLSGDCVWHVVGWVWLWMGVVMGGCGCGWVWSWVGVVVGAG